MTENKHETINVNDMFFDTSVYRVVSGDLVLDTKKHKLTLNKAVEMLDNHQKELSFQDNAIKRQEDFTSILFARMSDAEHGIKLTWILCFVNVLLSVGIALKISGMF